MKHMIKLVTLLLLALACGAAIEEDEGDLGSLEQSWISYQTGSGTRWGTQATQTGGRCYATQAQSADCRFVTMGGLNDPAYSVSVDSSFGSANRSLLLTLLSNIANGDAAVQGFNQQTGFPCNSGCAVQPPSLNINATVGSNSRIHVGQPGPLFNGDFSGC